MDALQIAREYKAMEADALGQLVTSGASLSVEIIADVKERLAVRRSWVCTIILSGYGKASKEERRELRAAVDLVNSPCIGAF